MIEKATRDESPDPAAGSSLARCLLVLLLGFCAGLQLGKIAPIALFFQSRHDYSLTTIGWLTALIGIFVAAAAIPAAKLIDRTGAPSSIKIGAVILTAGAVLLAISTSLLPHLAARSVEAVGYVLLVIAAPAYLATHASPRLRPVMLALWGSFVPVGYALANIQASIVVEIFGPVASLTSAALLLGLFTVAVLAFIPGAGLPGGGRRSAGQIGDVSRDAILLATGFGIYVLISLSFFTFLPTFLERNAGAHIISPAAIALFVPAGNLVAALLLAFVPARHTPGLAMAGFGVSALCAVFVFQETGIVTGVVAYPAFAFLGGMIASMIFGSVPRAATEKFSAAMVVGVIAQAGGIGTIAGPPLAGFLVDMFGWGALTWFLTALSLAGTLMMAPMVRVREHRIRQA